jgi:DNA-directed RNA polymerase subunit RPC12/RpoP
MTDVRHCRVCGAAFTRSRTDSTVNCPAHRGRARRAAVTVSKTVICRCGKTVIVDGFGSRTGNTCPVCGDS